MLFDLDLIYTCRVNSCHSDVDKITSLPVVLYPAVEIFLLLVDDL